MKRKVDTCTKSKQGGTKKGAICTKSKREGMKSKREGTKKCYY